MRKFVLTIPSVTGQITFGFNAEDLLIHYDNASEMSTEQLRWLWEKMPFTVKVLRDMGKVVKGSVAEVPMDLSFETFYNPYPNHRNRFRAEPIWTKLSDADKTKCILSVPAYKRYLDRSKIAPLLPENYLKQKQWLNQFDSL